MLAGIRNVLVITNPRERILFERLFGDASAELGMCIDFVDQMAPNGLPEAFTLAKEFYKDDIKLFKKIALILGDNIYYGAGLSQMLTDIKNSDKLDIASVFLQRVTDPHRFGIAEFNAKGVVVGVEEKPKTPKSNYAITGLYFFPIDVVDRTQYLVPSARGELEITDLIRTYIPDEKLRAEIMYRGMSWFDTGTPTSMLEASEFVKTIQDANALRVATESEFT